MANQIQIKRSSVAGKVPDAANIAVGELAVNLTDQKLYTKDGSGNVFLLGAGNTNNLIEGNTNLFYTNARARSSISVTGAATYNVATGIINVTGGVTSVNGANGAVVLTTANIAESGNLYYTNARVYSNVTSLLPTYTGNVGASNVVGTLTNTTIFSGGYSFVFNNVGNVIIPNAVRANVVSATVWEGLYTTNVIEGTNLYYTNARVYSNIAPLLTTANIAELTNLYYTNARVYSNVIGPLNLKANVVDLTTANVAELNNLYYTNARVYSNVIGLLNLKANVVDLTTSNVAEGTNLYYTNARVYSNIAPLLTTANIAELTNLYYTNARVYSNVIGPLNLKANVVDLTTSNVAEGTNLYYTNARVRSTISAANGINYNNSTGVITSGLSLQLVNTANAVSTSVANVSTIQFDSDSGFDLVDRANGIAKVQLNSTFKYWNVLGQANLVAFGLDTVRFAGNGLTLTTNPNAIPQTIFFNANVLSVNGQVGTVVLTTSNVAEGSNLYYSNARVYSNIAPLLTTANVAEVTNLYYTNARVYSNVIGLLNLKANVVDLTTSNVAELNNLYYTNARVYSNIINALPTYTGNISAGNVNTSSLVGSLANTTIRSSSYSFTFNNQGNLLVPVSVNTNTISANNWIGLYTSNVIENTNLYYSNARVYSNIAPLLTTANVSEITNLYYTNARVYSNVIGLLDLKANVVDLTTSNVAELNNLYYSNARVYSNIAPLLTTANVSEVINLYYTNARVYSNVIGLLNLKANVVDLTTSNVAELNNLYYTNARVYSNVISLLPNYSGNILVGNVVGTTNSNVTLIATGKIFTFDSQGNAVIPNAVVTNIVSANIWQNLYTSNVIENTNLYYTNARVYSNVSPLLALKANVVDLTTSNVAEGTNLYYTNARVRSALTSGNGIAYDTVTGNITLSPTGVTATTYGGSSSVGVITVDQFGRITAASNVAVAGVSSFTASGNSFTITTSAGSSFVANIQQDSVRLGTDTTGDYVRNVIAGTSIVITNQGGEGAAPTISTSQALDTHSSPTFANLLITGNLTVQGNAVQFSANTLVINDPLIQLGVNPIEGDGVDLGFFGHYKDTGDVERHAGLFRDATDGVFKLFANLDPEPVTVVDTANVSFRYADLYVANLTGTVIGTVSSLANHTTANLTEGTNLYYTNSRVRSTLSAGDNTILYDSTLGTIRANVTALGANVLSVNGKTGVVTLSTADIPESGANLYYSNARVYSNIAPLLTTQNVSEVINLYYSNARVYSNIAPLLTTANVAEVVNLYYSNARVYSNIAPLLTTANVAEVTNLYYTNARVYSNIVSALPTYSGNITVGNVVGTTPGVVTLIASDKTFTFNSSGNALIPGTVVTNSISSNIWIGLYTSNVIENTNLYYSNARVYSNIAPLLTTQNVSEVINLYYSNARVYSNIAPLLTTANVAEVTNLYYTNARVYSNVIGLLNLKANVVDLTTANVLELNNLYYTNARVYSNVIGLLNLKANVTDLTTSNVAEGTNLYYTNSRVRSTLSAGDNTIIYDSTLGTIRANVVALGANVTSVNGLTGVVTLSTANIAEQGANLYYSNTRVYSNIAPLLTTANVSEITNLYYTNARVYSNVIALLPNYAGNILIGNLVGTSASDVTLVATDKTFTFTSTGNALVPGNVVTNAIFANVWSGLYTSNVIENTNLYYTNARVYSNISPLLTTANITELTNLYYSNARVYSNIGPLLTTANITELTNLYYSNSRVYSNIAPLLTTANITELTNLYYTNSRVYSNVISLLPNYTGNVGGNLIGTGSNTTIIAGNFTYSFLNTGELQLPNIRANVLYANIIQGATTSNITEGTNLYYSNSRVYSNIAPLLTTANITELTNLYYTNARVYSNVISLLPNYTGNVGGNIVGTDSNTLIIAGNFTYSFLNTGELQLPNIRANVLYANIIQGATTSNIAEGSNLYYTNARARTAISVTGSGSYNNTTGIINIAGTTIYSGPGITYESGNGNVSFTEYLFPTGDYGDLTTSLYDAFGALIYIQMDMMNPPGSIVTVDLGVL